LCDRPRRKQWFQRTIVGNRNFVLVSGLVHGNVDQARWIGGPHALDDTAL